MKGNIYSAARSQGEAIEQASTKTQFKVMADSITSKVEGVKTYVQSRGENLITNGNGLLLDNTNFSTFTFDPVQSYAGGGSFYSNAQNATRFNDELIPVNPTNEYRFSFMAKSKTGQGKYYFMAGCYDIDTLSISPFMTYGSTRPIVALAADLKVGDTTITLTSVDGFEDANFSESGGHRHSIVFWGYRNSKGYTYPDGTYSRLYRDAMWNDGGINRTTKVITLNKPWNLANPYDPEGIWRTGQKVSGTQSGGSYKYFAGSNVFVPTEWTKLEGTISGTGLGTFQFMPGTAYVLLGGLLNRSSSGGTAGDEIWLNSLEFYNLTSENKGKEYTNSQIQQTKDSININVAKTFSGVRVRYIRDWLNGSSANAGDHWVQIQAFRDGVNLALNKPVTSSSAGTSLAFATNGNTTTGNYAAINAGGLAWIQVDLGYIAADIDHLMIYHYYGDGRTYYGTKTEVSEDGVNWFPLFDSAASGTYQETSLGKKIYVNPNKVLNTAESSIKVSSDKIALVVKTDNTVDGRAIASSINQTANDIQIQASKININGAVSFSAFDNTIKSIIASGESDLFNTNQNFLDYPTSPGVPTGYANESGPVPTRVASDNATGYSVQMTTAAGQSNFFAQTINNQGYTDYVTVTATFKLVSGALDGSGILFRQNRSSGYYDYVLGFKNILPNPLLNKWYTVTKTFKATGTDFSSYKIYIMAGWTGFYENTVAAKTIQMDSASARAATQAEIDAFTAEGSVAGWRMAGKTTINGGSIETNTITATQIKGRTITATEIATNTLTANEIKGGTITAAEIAANSITAGKMILGDTTNYVSVSENDTKTTVTAFGGTTISGGYVKKIAASNQYMMMSDYISNPFKKDDEVFFKFKGKVATATPVPLYVFYYNSSFQNTGSDIVGTLSMTTSEAPYQGSYRIASNATNAATYVLIGFNCLNVDLSVKEMEFKKKNTGDLIVDGAITANKIAANSVRAESLYIGDPTNMMQYDEMTYSGNYTVITHTDSQKYFKVGQAAYSTLQMARSERIEFKVGDSYYLSFNGFKESAITGGINFIIRYYYKEGGFLNAGIASIPFTTTTSALEAIVKINAVPETGKTVARVDFFIEKDSTTTGFYYVRNLELRKMMAGKMIVDGTIDAGKVRISTATGNNDVVIDQYGVTATRGTQKVLMNSTDGFAIKDGTTNIMTISTAGVVTANNFVMNSGSVPGGSVGSGIQGGNITVGTIDAGKITISTVTGSNNVVLNTNGLVATRGTVTTGMNSTEGFFIKNSGTPTFSVDAAGAITASKMTLNGSSTINVGGGVVINSAGLVATGSVNNKSVVTTMNATDGFKIAVAGTTKFSVDSSGDITATGLNISSGSIDGSQITLRKSVTGPFNSGTRVLSADLKPLFFDTDYMNLSLFRIGVEDPANGYSPQSIYMGVHDWDNWIYSEKGTLRIESEYGVYVASTRSITLNSSTGSVDIYGRGGDVSIKGFEKNVKLSASKTFPITTSMSETRQVDVLTDGATGAMVVDSWYGKASIYSNTNITDGNYNEVVLSLAPSDDSLSGIQVFGRKDSVGIYDRKNKATFVRYTTNNDLSFYSKKTMEFWTETTNGRNTSIMKFDGTKEQYGVWVEIGGGSRTHIISGESNVNLEDHLLFSADSESMVLESNKNMYFVWNTDSGFSKSSTKTQMEANSNAIMLTENCMRPTVSNKTSLGLSTYKWTTVYANTTTINSDSRTKREIRKIRGADWSTDAFSDRLASGEPLIDASDVHAFMKELPIYQFEYENVDGPEKAQYGFIADQALANDPKKVARLFVYEDEDKDTMLSVSTQSYAAAIHMTLQQEMDRNDKLEKEVKSLRRLVTKIQKQLKEGA